MVQELFVWSKKFHKWVMWAVMVLGGYMMLSGLLMRRELEGEWIPPAIDMTFMRAWHNNVSQWFVIVLLAQMLTGLAMWWLPKVLKKRAAAKTNANTV